MIQAIIESDTQQFFSQLPPEPNYLILYFAMIALALCLVKNKRV